MCPEVPTHQLCVHTSTPSTPAVVARRRPKGGAYLVHVRHARGVPRADVRIVACRRPVERLRAEPHALHCRPKGPRTFRRGYACAAAHTGARTHKDTHACKYDAQAHIADLFLEM